MASLYTGEVNGEAFDLIYEVGDIYVFENQEKLNVFSWPAWCYECKKMTLSERRLTLDDLERDIREMEYFAKYPGLIPPGRYINIGRLPDLRRYHAWQSVRISPPRCLDCGSQKIFISPDLPPIRIGHLSQVEFEIPSVGQCRMQFGGRLSLGYERTRYFTPEGLRILDE